MLGDAFRYPVRDSETRTASAYATGAVLATAILLGLGAALWPSWSSMLPASLSVVPAVLFVAHLAAILHVSTSDSTTSSAAQTRPDTSVAIPFRVDWERVRLGLRVLAVAVAYLLVPAVLLASGGYLIASGVLPVEATGLVVSVVATVVLLIVVVFTYLLPGAIEVGARDGIQAGLQRSALRGLGSGSYFVAWTGAAVLTVLAWGAVSATTPRTLGGFVAIVWFTYAHLTAARLLGLGLTGVRRKQRSADHRGVAGE